MNLLDWLLNGQFHVGGGTLSVREVVGNLFGLASALLGMRRLVWAWPVGLVGNVLLFTVFVSGQLSGVTTEPLWGQAGRQVFFIAMALYGWVRWARLRSEGGAADGGAIAPRWATARERIQNASKALALGAIAPSGKPTTAQTITPEPRSSRLAKGTKPVFTHTDAKRY